MDVQQVVAWLKRLVYLDTRVFDDVRSNPTATLPGFLVASVAIFLSGIGGYLWWMLQDFGQSSDILVHSVILGSLLAIVLWGVWLLIVYFLLTQVFRQRAYLEQLLRVMGLATAPLALTFFMFVPFASFAIGIAALALVFGLTCVAISSVTTATPAQVLVVNLAGFFVWALALSILASGSGTGERKPHAPGIFLYQSIVDVIADASDASNTPAIAQ